jgi:glutamate-5-semialdehyde dehydrogenase
MPSAIAGLEAQGRAAKAAAHRLAYLSTDIKNQALHNICQEVLARADEILTANQRDYRAAQASGMSAHMLDRLMLNSSRLEGIAQDMLAIAALPDPVGEVFDMRTGGNGLQIGRKRVPLGVIGAIYESPG